MQPFGDQLSFLTIQRVSLLRVGGTVSHTVHLIGEAVLVPALAFVRERVAIVIGGVVVNKRVRCRACASIRRQFTKLCGNK